MESPLPTGAYEYTKWVREMFGRRLLPRMIHQAIPAPLLYLPQVGEGKEGRAPLCQNRSMRPMCTSKGYLKGQLRARKPAFDKNTNL